MPRILHLPEHLASTDVATRAEGIVAQADVARQAPEKEAAEVVRAVSKATAAPEVMPV